MTTKLKRTLGWLDQLLAARVHRTQVDAMNIALVCQKIDHFHRIKQRQVQMRQTCALLEKRG